MGLICVPSRKIAVIHSLPLRFLVNKRNLSEEHFTFLFREWPLLGGFTSICHQGKEETYTCSVFMWIRKPGHFDKGAGKIKDFLLAFALKIAKLCFLSLPPFLIKFYFGHFQCENLKTNKSDFFITVPY